MSETAIRLYGFTMRFQAKGAEQWERYLLDLAGRARDLRLVFDRFGAYMVDGSIQRNFDARGRPGRWPALSPLYAERKARLWPGKGILERTGAMRAGFTWEATPQTLKIRNSAPYFRYHQEGAPRAHLPQRIMVYLQDADKSVLVRWVRDYIRTGYVEP